ncbi:MAG: AMP-binding protein, partial [bacterium]|nr:AMP-binding protein [bacterium]
CAPLNPAYREEEFRFYLSDLNARAMIAPRGVPTPARDAAHELGIRVIELEIPPEAPTGVFRLIGENTLNAPPGLPGPEDVALVLHTSGTTSRPKIVPLSHANLIASARSIADTLQLSPSDRCLNIMPLFHIHGLVGAALSSLTSGGSLVCTTGFDASRFFDWLDESRPSWYTAVPTMHQGILARAARHADVLARVSLRFIRSSSSALPPQVMADLERVFSAPVIESYGMTEASHQMASNPLPPCARKPGSVGLPAGPQLGVMDQAGRLVPQGVTGEIVIRGPSVTAGYENNSEANRAAFTEGWFRTGDQGHIDEDGYLFLTGRLKELINRGGEKISPREIDEVLLDHAAVGQAVAFAVADPQLGEDVAAAVVLRPERQVSSLELREFVAGRLANF